MNSAVVLKSFSEFGANVAVPPLIDADNLSLSDETEYVSKSSSLSVKYWDKLIAVVPFIVNEFGPSHSGLWFFFFLSWSLSFSSSFPSPSLFSLSSFTANPVISELWFDAAAPVLSFNFELSNIKYLIPLLSM